MQATTERARGALSRRAAVEIPSSCDRLLRADGRDEDLFQGERLRSNRLRRSMTQLVEQFRGVAAAHDFQLTVATPQDASPGKFELAGIGRETDVDLLEPRARRIRPERQHVAAVIDDRELVDQPL